MPRQIDFIQGNTTEYNEVRLPEPRYGRNEISSIDEFLTGFHLGYRYTPQFYANRNADENWPRRMIEAHEWLSQHSTGPWFWNEGWSNHGHSLGVVLYIERLPDQKAFNEKFGNVFEYYPNDEKNLELVAILKGSVPPYTAQESLLVWKNEHRGYELDEVDGSVEPRIVRLTFTIPAMQEKFVADWGHVFKLDGRPNSFVGPWCSGTRQTVGDPLKYLGRWLDENDSTGNESGDSEGHRIEVRYPETIAAFQKDWGHIWHLASQSGERAIFAAPLQPFPHTLPDRSIPDDFRAYINGEREDYVAPYVGVLNPKRPSGSSREQHVAPVLANGQ